MIHIIVYGFPKMSQNKLHKCCDEIRAVPGKAVGVFVPARRVMVSFPGEQLNAGLGEELMVYVQGLEISCHTVPSKELKDDLCSDIGAVLQKYMPKNCERILVQTCQPDPNHEGYSEGLF
ncbi:MAG: hypothetical protein Q7R65_01700 [bacterium]|nr:hypothetical protein [bacterium]